MFSFQPDGLPEDDLHTISKKVGGWLDKRAVDSFHKAAGGTVAPQGLLTAARSRSKQAAPPQFELGETFALWTLELDAIVKGLQTGDDLIKLAGPSGRWHHQIRVNQQPVGYARTCRPEDEAVEAAPQRRRRSKAKNQPAGPASAYQTESGNDFSLRQLYVSDLGAAIADAIRWIDNFEKKNQEYASDNPLVRLLYVQAYYVTAFWLVKEREGESDLLLIDAPLSLKGLRYDRLLSSREFLEAFRDAPRPIGGLV